MTKSGLADSPFFSQPPNMSSPVPSLQAEKPLAVNTMKKSQTSAEIVKSQITEKPRHRDTMTPRNHDTVVSSNHDTMNVVDIRSTIQTVRKAVKELGKEAATHRFTLEEKKAVLDIIYSYKGLGIRTSENEVARIAINYVLEDYKQNGRNSILDQVLRALNE